MINAHPDELSFFSAGPQITPGPEAKVLMQKGALAPMNTYEWIRSCQEGVSKGVIVLFPGKSGEMFVPECIT